MDEELRDLYFRGKELYNSQKYEAALELFERFIERNESFADVYNFLGFIYHHFGRFDEAIAFFQRALSINPKYTDAALNLTVVFNDTGQYNKAKEIYNEIFELSVDRKSGQQITDNFVRGKLANMHCALADVYSSMGIYEDAIDEYRKALRLEPEFVDIINKLGVSLRESGQLDEAEDCFKNAIDIRPGYPIAWLNLGLTLYSKTEYEQARKALMEVTDLVPEHRSATTYIRLIDEKLK